MPSRSVEILLRSHAQGLDETMAPVTFDEVRREAETRSRPLPQVGMRRFRPAGAWVAVAAGVSVLALIGLVAAMITLFSDDAPPVIDTPTTILSDNPTPTTTPPPTTIPPATTTIPAPVPAVELTWERLEPFGRTLFPERPVRLGAVVAGPDQFVAAADDGLEAGFATSFDGRGWSLSDHPGSVDELTYGPPGYVAVGGTRQGTPGVWTSPDGLTWTPPSDPGTLLEHQPREVGWGEDGYIIVAEDPTSMLPVLFHSVDGSSWSPVVIPYDEWMLDDGLGFGWTSHLAYGPSGYMLAASEYTCGGSAIWHSPDGLNWTLLPHDEEAFGPIGGYCTEEFGGAFTFHDAAYGDAGYVVVGMHDFPRRTTAGVLVSQDGINWTRVPQAPLEVPYWMNGITAGGGGFVAAGEVAQSQPIIWTSPDGSTWTPVSDETLFTFTATAENPLGGDELIGVSTGTAVVVAALDDTWIVTGDMGINQFPNPDDPTNANPVSGPTTTPIWRGTLSD